VLVESTVITDKLLDISKVAIAMRSVRIAIGWNQQEFSELLKVAKSTVARIETMEVNPKADVVLRAMRLFREAGVDVDLSQPGIRVNISESALEDAIAKLQDTNRRRSDKK
jgi:transcriptional regulator with XRE-family HTH domain